MSELTVANAKKLGVDVTKLTLMGSMNYVVQAFREKNDETGEITFSYDIYQPRKNRIRSGDESSMSYEDLIISMKETLERMKIAERNIRDFIDGKTDVFYYWDCKDESYLQQNLA